MDFVLNEIIVGAGKGSKASLPQILKGDLQRQAGKVQIKLEENLLLSIPFTCLLLRPFPSNG
jgi:hypothetical protein